MKTINELQDEVVEEFSDFDDWMDKYQMLIDLGNELKPLDEKYKTEQNLIDGCQSRVCGCNATWSTVSSCSLPTATRSSSRASSPCSYR